MTLPPIALEIYVVCLGIFLLMLDAFSAAPKKFIGRFAIFGLLAILALTFFVHPEAVAADRFYLADPLAMFFKRFLLLATILTIALALDYSAVYLRFVPSATPQAGLGEFFALPVFACAGLMWMVSANDFIMIFVSLELVTISFYILVASMRKNNACLEAGVKYLILGALSTGFIVYGITWVSGLLNTTSLTVIGATLPNVFVQYHPAILFGFGLILVALGFKVAAVPFQFWVADVYQGAPTPITAYLSVASKAAGFVVLLRVVQPFLLVPALETKVIGILTILAALTLLFGNLAALPQNNLKRLLAYSSVAHAGYLLTGVASVRSDEAGRAIVFYLAGYLLMTFLAFLVLQHVAQASGGDRISDFNGLGRRSPVLARGMLVAMISLAGLPFTVGFLGKFFIFQAAMQSQQYLLVFLGAITVACGFYYYLKVVQAMYWKPALEDAAPIEVPGSTRFLIAILCIAIFVLGVFPQPVLAMLK